MGILCLCLFSCEHGKKPDTTTAIKPPDTNATAYKSEKDVEDAYSSDTGNWRNASPGDESIAITNLLLETGIPCGDYLISEKDNSKGVYICACRPGVDNNEHWTYLELWPALDKWQKIKSSDVENKAPQN